MLYENKESFKRGILDDIEIYCFKLYIYCWVYKIVSFSGLLNFRYVEGFGRILSYKIKGIDKNEGKLFVRKGSVYVEVRSKDDMCRL